MNKLFSVFHRGISAKLFLINLIVFVMFSVIAAAAFFSFRHMKDTLTDIFSVQLDQALESAYLGRELVRVIADINLLVSTFHEKEKTLKADGEKLGNKVYILMLKSSDLQLKRILDNFIKKIRNVLKQCAIVNSDRESVKAISQEIEHSLIALGEIVSWEIVGLEQGNERVAHLERLSIMILEYRELLIRLKLRFTKMGTGGGESSETEAAPTVFTLLDTLQMKVGNLNAYAPDIAGQGKQISRDIREYKDALSQFYESVKTLKQRRDEMNREKELLLTRMGETDELIEKKTEQGMNDLTEQLSNGAKVGGVAFFIIALVVIFLAAFLGLSITRSLRLVVHRIRGIAKGEGDLTTRLDVRTKDELGSLARWFNIFIENLQGMMKDIAEQARTLNTFAADMSSVSVRMSAGADEVSEKSESVATSAEEMSVNINTMASSAEEISVNVQSISSTAEQMSRNMNSVASSVEKMGAAINHISENARDGARVSVDAKKMAETATSTMNNLEDAVKQIGEVIEIIGKIADKTNLLALNARIEAASAGESGKGFAVVANEIKELSDQSGRASRDVVGRIEGVQESTGYAIAAIGDVSHIINTISDSVETISEAVEHQRQATHEISTSVSQTDTGTSHIAAAISEIARGVIDMSRNAGEAAMVTNEVAANIQHVSQTANDSSEGARAVSMSAGELAKIAAQLEELVHKFKVD